MSFLIQTHTANSTAVNKVKTLLYFKSLEESINEETREFVKGWVNPRTKKIIAWRHHTPYHATHIYENLSKYGLTKDDLIDHHIDVVSKRNEQFSSQ